MIDIVIQYDLLILLRACLLLGPLFVMFYLCWKHRYEYRFLVGGIFSFLYSMGLLLPAHSLAIHFGMWHYGGEALMILGMPADIWFAGSFLFGPVIFWAFPKLNPLFFTILFVGLQAVFFRSLDPFVIAGNNWFLGISLVFIIVHIPALYLARWTAYNECLPQRAGLLAFGYGFLAFVVLPTMIMQAMGGEWALLDKPAWQYIITTLCLIPCMVIGLNGVHMFVVHGEGTPIPLDNTQHLVKSGIYAYIINPMQLCSALSWVIIGIFLKNIYVAMASIMAVVFVLGMVRWHHRHDLEVRFPEGWLEYKTNVPEWFPRWKPLVKEKALFEWTPSSKFQKNYAYWLQKQSPVGMKIIEKEGAPARYVDGNDGKVFFSQTALVYPLFHINFFWAVVASGLLFFLLPYEWLNVSKSKGS